MEKVKEKILERKKELERLLRIMEKERHHYPEGSLKVIARGDHVQYYQRIKHNRSTDQTRYLKKSESGLVHGLAQKEYDEALRKLVEKELWGLNQMLRYYPEEHAEDAYRQLLKWKQVLVEPFVVPEEIYVEQWLSETFRRKEFLTDDSSEFITDRGERVRSKSEIMIANALYKNELAYHYERPMFLGDATIYPDFTILKMPERSEIIWEHLGMMDDEMYAANAVRRVNDYEREGYGLGDSLLITMETRACPLSSKQVERVIARHFG